METTKVEITRETSYRGKPAKVGDVVDVTPAERHTLLSQKMGKDHIPAAAPQKPGVSK